MVSLELGRAQAVCEGQARIEEALNLSRYLTSRLQCDPYRDFFSLNSSKALESPYVTMDPLRLSLHVAKSGASAAELKQFLFDKFGVYINHVTHSSLLINIHMGVSREAVDRLLEGLSAFARGLRAAPPELCRGFIISYPPGIPLALPGELMTAELKRQIAKLQTEGAVIYSLAK